MDDIYSKELEKYRLIVKLIQDNYQSLELSDEDAAGLYPVIKTHFTYTTVVKQHLVIRGLTAQIKESKNGN